MESSPGSLYAPSRIFPDNCDAFGIVRPLLRTKDMAGASRAMALLGVPAKPDCSAAAEALAALHSLARGGEGGGGGRGGSKSVKHPGIPPIPIAVQGSPKLAHHKWLTRCLYEHVYPALPEDSEITEVWVSAASDRDVAPRLVPRSRVALEGPAFSPVLCQLPAEASNVPALRSSLKLRFDTADCVGGLLRIAEEFKPMPLDKAARPLLQAAGERSRWVVDLSVALVRHLHGLLVAGSADGHCLPPPPGLLLPTRDLGLLPAENCVADPDADDDLAASGLQDLPLVHPMVPTKIAVELGARTRDDAVLLIDGAADGALQVSDVLKIDSTFFHSQGSALLNMLEIMVTSADHAGASEVHFIWDWRSVGQSSASMAPQRGPCLYALYGCELHVEQLEELRIGAFQGHGLIEDTCAVTALSGGVPPRLFEMSKEEKSCSEYNASDGDQREEVEQLEAGMPMVSPRPNLSEIPSELQEDYASYRGVLDSLQLKGCIDGFSLVRLPLRATAVSAGSGKSRQSKPRQKDAGGFRTDQEVVLAACAVSDRMLAETAVRQMAFAVPAWLSRCDRMKLVQVLDLSLKKGQDDPVLVPLFNRRIRFTGGLEPEPEGGHDVQRDPRFAAYNPNGASLITPRGGRSARVRPDGPEFVPPNGGQGDTDKDGPRGKQQCGCAIL